MLTQFDFNTPSTRAITAARQRPTLAARTMLLFNRWQQEEDGQTLVEYGLLISLVTLVVIAAMTLLGNKVKNFYGSAANQIPANPNP